VDRRDDDGAARSLRRSNADLDRRLAAVLGQYVVNALTGDRRQRPAEDRGRVVVAGYDPAAPVDDKDRLGGRVEKRL
jgi:hypothetical protein